MTRWQQCCTYCCAQIYSPVYTPVLPAKWLNNWICSASRSIWLHPLTSLSHCEAVTDNMVQSCSSPNFTRNLCMHSVLSSSSLHPHPSSLILTFYFCVIVLWKWYTPHSAWFTHACQLRVHGIQLWVTVEKRFFIAYTHTLHSPPYLWKMRFTWEKLFNLRDIFRKKI